MSINTNIKKTDATKVQVKKLPALSDINAIPWLTKETITAIPGLTKETIGTIPYLKKENIAKVDPYAFKDTPFEWHQEPVDPDWQKVLDNAKLLANTNDAKEINSFADIIYAAINPTTDYEGGVTEKFLDKWGINLDRIPILNIIPRTADYLWQYQIKPITQGQWGIAGMNLSTNFVETADILANPVKGLFIEGATGFKKATGFSEEGRVNYEYEFGDGAGWGTLEFLAELASDPGLWATIGTGILVKSVASGVKGLSKVFLSKGSKEILNNVFETAVKSGLKEVVEEAGEKATKEWFKKVLKHTFSATARNGVVDVKEITETLINTSAKKLNTELAEKITVDMVHDVAETIVKGSKTFSDEITLKILTTVDKIDNTAIKAVFYPGFVLPYKGVKQIVKTYNSRILRTLEPFVQNKEALSAFDYAEVMAKVSDVGDSLIKAANDVGIQGLKDTEIQKAFFRATKEDLNNIQRIINKNKSSLKIGNSSAFMFELKDYLIKRHGLDEALSVEEMLQAYKKVLTDASNQSDIFAGLSKNIDNLLNTIEKIKKIKEYNKFFEDLARESTDTFSSNVDNLFKQTNESTISKQLNNVVDQVFKKRNRDIAEVVAKQILKSDPNLTVSTGLLSIVTEAVQDVMSTNSKEALEFLQLYTTEDVNKIIKEVVDQQNVLFKTDLKEEVTTKLIENISEQLFPEAVADIRRAQKAELIFQAKHGNFKSYKTTNLSAVLKKKLNKVLSIDLSPYIKEYGKESAKLADDVHVASIAFKQDVAASFLKYMDTVIKNQDSFLVKSQDEKTIAFLNETTVKLLEDLKHARAYYVKFQETYAKNYTGLSKIKATPVINFVKDVQTKIKDVVKSVDAEGAIKITDAPTVDRDVVLELTTNLEDIVHFFDEVLNTPVYTGTDAFVKEAHTLSEILNTLNNVLATTDDAIDAYVVQDALDALRNLHYTHTKALEEHMSAEGMRTSVKTMSFRAIDVPILKDPQKLVDKASKINGEIKVKQEVHVKRAKATYKHLEKLDKEIKNKLNRILYGLEPPRSQKVVKQGGRVYTINYKAGLTETLYKKNYSKISKISKVEDILKNESTIRELISLIPEWSVRNKKYKLFLKDTLDSIIEGARESIYLKRILDYDIAQYMDLEAQKVVVPNLLRRDVTKEMWEEAKNLVKDKTTRRIYNIKKSLNDIAVFKKDKIVPLQKRIDALRKTNEQIYKLFSKPYSFENYNLIKSLTNYSTKTASYIKPKTAFEKIKQNSNKILKHNEALIIRYEKQIKELSASMPSEEALRKELQLLQDTKLSEVELQNMYAEALEELGYKAPLHTTTSLKRKNFFKPDISVPTKAAKNLQTEKELYDKLESLINILQDNINTPLMDFSTIGESALYTYKLEQTYVSLLYITDEIASKFIHSINDMDGNILEVISEYSNKEYVDTLIKNAKTEAEAAMYKALSEGCQMLQKGADSACAYEQLVNTLENTEVISPELTSALLSTLNTYKIAQTKVDKVAANPEEFFEMIFEGVQNYVNAKRTLQKYSLDAYRAEKAVDEFFEKLLGVTAEVWKAMAHRSDADILTNKYFIKDKLPHFKLRKNDIFIDAETTGLEAAQKEVLDVSLQIDGKTIIFKRNLDKSAKEAFPSNSLLDVYADGKKTTNELVDEYYAYYNKNYKGPQYAQEVYYFDSEGDLIKAVVEYLYKNGKVMQDAAGNWLRYDNNSARIIGHNISNFDLGFLKTRIKKADTKTAQLLEDVFGRFEVVDTYKLIQREHNLLELDDIQKRNIKDLLQPYIALRTQYVAGFDLWHTGEAFINSLPIELTAGIRKLIDAMDSDAAAFARHHSGKQKVRLSVDLYGPEAKQVIEKNSLQAILDHLIELRRNVRRTNELLGEDVFTANQFNDDHVRAILKDFIKKQISNKKSRFYQWTEEQINNYIKYLNPTKAHYVNDDLVNLVGYKKIFDPKLVRSWYDLAEAEYLPKKLATAMFNTARAIERQAKYITNPKAILPYAEDLTKFLTTVKASGLLEKSNNAALKYLITDTDAIVEKYALARFLYTNLRVLAANEKITTAEIDEIFKTAPVAQVFENHKLFVHHTVRDTDLTFAQMNTLLTDSIDGDMLDLAKKWQVLKTDFAKSIEEFNYSEAFEELGIFSADVEIRSQGAQQVYKLLDDFVKLLNSPEVDTNQLYDIQNKLYFITDNLNIQTLRNVLNYKTPEQLLQNLAWSGGLTSFTKYDAPDIYNKLIKDSSVLNDAGIIIKSDGHRVWLAIDRKRVKYACELLSENDITTKHVYINGADISRPKYLELDVQAAINACKEAPQFIRHTEAGEAYTHGVLNALELDKLAQNIINARQGLHTITDNMSVGVHTEVMDKKTFRHIYEQAPKEIQDAIGSVDSFIDDSAWFSEMSFNLSNLGSNAAKRELQKGLPTHLMYTYKLNTDLALKTYHTKLKFVDFMCNNEMRLDIGMWADEANDEVVLKYLKDHPELTVAALIKDAKVAKGYNIKRIVINTVEDLHNARRLHASVMTNQMYSRTASVVYSSVFDSGALNTFAKISRIYKLGSLAFFNTGWIMRNFIDSAIKEIINNESIINTVREWRNSIKDLKSYDNALRALMATSQLDTEAIERIARLYGVTPEQVLKDINFNVAALKNAQLKDVINASNLYMKYNTAITEIIKTDSNAVLRPQNIDFYFKYMAKDFDKETFYAVHRFITQGASAGETKALKEAFEKTLKNRGVQPEQEARGVLDSVSSFLGCFATPNTHLEQIIRLSQHMFQMRKGMSFAESNLRIAKVHFDYADKTDVTRLVELAIPFYNFKMKNFCYWADIIETQPWVMRFFAEVMDGVWDFDNYDTYQEHLELANNPSLQYQIMSGNIPLNDMGMTLKVNPSIMDAIQITQDPFGTTESSLFTPLNLMFKDGMVELYQRGLLNEFWSNTFGLNDNTAKHSSIPKILLHAMPAVGPVAQRMRDSGPKYADRLQEAGASKLSQNLVKTLPSVFGATSRWNLSNIKSPEEYAAMVDYYRKRWEANSIKFRNAYNNKRIKRAWYQQNYGNKNYTKKSYAKKSYKRKTYYNKYYKRKAYFNKSYNKQTRYNKSYNKQTYYNKPYNKYYKYSKNSRYYNQYNPSYSKHVNYYNKPYNRYTEYSLAKSMRVPKMPYNENIYWKYYTKTGKRRMDILNAKATQKNLQMKIKLMYDYYR